MIRILIILLALSVPVLAEEPRKIDFTQTLLDQDGEIVLECAEVPLPKDDRDCKVRRPITLGMLSLRALAQPEQNLSPEESLKRGALALAVYKAPAAKLTAEEISLIKKQIAKAFNPLLAAITAPLLDPAVK